MEQYNGNITVGVAAPDETRYKDRNMTVTYGYHLTSIGEILAGQTEYGVCYLGFAAAEDRDYPFRRMQKHMPHATYVANDNAAKEVTDKIMNIWQGGAAISDRLALDLHGTDFQIQVWQALLKIPSGTTVCYQDIAKAIGRPKSSRAVGNAVGSNPVSLLVPCHRVIQKSGIIGHYGWGTAQKKLILEREARNES